MSRDGILARMTWLPLVTSACLVAAVAAQQPHVAVIRGEVRGCGGDEKPRVTLFHSEGMRGTVEAVAEVMGEPGGRFELRDVPWFEGYDWDWNWVILVARVGDRVGMRQIRGDIDTDTVALELRRTRTLRGALRGALRDERSGKSIAGAWVWPMIFGLPGADEPLVWPTAPMMPWHVRTDENGRFEMAGVPVYSGYVLVAGGSEHGRRQLRVTDPSSPITAMLSPAGRIEGRVLLPDGSPARGVDVWATGSRDGFARARTDATGGFVIPSLAAETFRLQVWWPDRPGLLARDVVVSAGESTAVELQFRHSGIVAGRLVDVATGVAFLPTGRTYVTARGDERDGVRAIRTGPVAADGTFRIRAPIGPVDLAVGAAGVVHVGSPRVVVKADEEIEVELTVRKTVRVRRR